MEAQKVLKIVEGKLCAVENKHHGHGYYSTTAKPLAQATKKYNDDECKLVFDYIVNKIKGTLDIVAQPVQEYLLDCKDGWSHSHSMNENIGECINYIVTNVIEQSACFAPTKTPSVSLGYFGPTIYFNIIRKSDGGVGFSSEFRFLQPISSWHPTAPSETDPRLEIISGQMCIVIKSVPGGGRQRHQHLITLAQPVLTYDSDECKQVFDYISKKLNERMTAVTRDLQKWHYSYPMNDDIEKCINNMIEHSGTSSIFIWHNEDTIYFDLMDSEGNPPRS